MFLRQCIRLYECVAGQRINFQKSALSFGPGVRNAEKERIQSILGVPIVPFHEKYLGIAYLDGQE